MMTNKTILLNLAAVANSLDELKFKKEADDLDLVMRKISELYFDPDEDEWIGGDEADYRSLHSDVPEWMQMSTVPRDDSAEYSANMQDDEEGFSDSNYTEFRELLPGVESDMAIRDKALRGLDKDISDLTAKILDQEETRGKILRSNESINLIYGEAEAALHRISSLREDLNEIVRSSESSISERDIAAEIIQFFSYDIEIEDREIAANRWGRLYKMDADLVENIDEIIGSQISLDETAINRLIKDVNDIIEESGAESGSNDSVSNWINFELELINLLKLNDALEEAVHILEMKMLSTTSSPATDLDYQLESAEQDKRFWENKEVFDPETSSEKQQRFENSMIPVGHDIEDAVTTNDNEDEDEVSGLETLFSSIGPKTLVSR
jgi:hypothetical protein